MDIHNNIYDLLGLRVGCNLDKINEGYEKYKDLCERRLNDPSREKEKQKYLNVLKVLEEEYNKVKRSKDDYDDLVFQRRNANAGKPDEDTEKLLDEYAEENIVKEDVKAYKNHKNVEYFTGIRGFDERKAVDDAIEKDRKHKKIEKKQEKKYKLQRIAKVAVVVTSVALIVVGATHYIHKLDGRTIKVPAQQTQTYQSEESQTPTYKDSEEDKLVMMAYTVVDGDTISGIEERFHCTIDFNLNKDLKNANYIYQGQVIYIMVPEEVRKKYDEQREKLKKESEPVSYEEYKIVEGDTLPEIADKFGVTPQDIINVNENLKFVSDTIYAGQYLIIPIFPKTINNK